MAHFRCDQNRHCRFLCPMYRTEGCMVHCHFDIVQLSLLVCKVSAVADSAMIKTREKLHALFIVHSSLGLERKVNLAESWITCLSPYCSNIVSHSGTWHVYSFIPLCIVHSSSRVFTSLSKFTQLCISSSPYAFTSPALAFLHHDTRLRSSPTPSPVSRERERQSSLTPIPSFTRTFRTNFITSRELDFFAWILTLHADPFSRRRADVWLDNGYI